MSKLVTHLKGKKIDGERKPVYYPTHVNFVDGLEDKVIEVTVNNSETTAALSMVEAKADSAVSIAQAAMEVASGNAYTLPAATSAQIGGVKLYSTLGTNADGAVSQAAITTAISNATVSAANAEKATKDSAGNVISDTYVTSSYLEEYMANLSVEAKGLIAKPVVTVLIGKTVEIETLALNGNGGTLTASSTSTAIAIVDIVNGTVQVTGVAAGSANITITRQNGTVTDSAVVAVTVVESLLNAASWSSISKISKTGEGALYWDVGDTKQITLNGKVGNQLTLTNQSLCVFILDFNHAMNGTAENNIIWGGFKSALTNGVDVALADAKYGSTSTDGTICFTMNHKGQTTTSGSAGYYNTNYGGWKGSDLRYDILGATSTAPSEYNQLKTTSNVGYDATSATLTSPKADTLLAALPSDLRNVIRLWTRWVDAVGNSSNVDANIKATVDAITLLTEYEVQGARSYANTYEQNHQRQMAYYANGNSKVKYKHSATTTAVNWWTASPNYNNAYSFCYVNTSGSANDNNANYSYALAPAFKT